MPLCCLKLGFFYQLRYIYSKFNILATFCIVFFRNFGQNYGFWASRFVASLLASGYPLHHLHAFRVRTRGAHSPHALRWFRYYPSRLRALWARVSLHGVSSALVGGYQCE
jgi:hypothetical protein